MAMRLSVTIILSDRRALYNAIANIAIMMTPIVLWGGTGYYGPHVDLPALATSGRFAAVRR